MAQSGNNEYLDVTFGTAFWGWNKAKRSTKDNDLVSEEHGIPR